MDANRLSSLQSVPYQQYTATKTYEFQVHGVVGEVIESEEMPIKPMSTLADNYDSNDNP